MDRRVPRVADESDYDVNGASTPAGATDCRQTAIIMEPSTWASQKQLSCDFGDVCCNFGSDVCADRLRDVSLQFW